MKATSFHTRRLSGLAVACPLALLIVACGGAQEAEKSAEASSGASPALSRLAEGGNAPGPASAREAAQLAQGARLSSADLQAAELRAEAAERAQAKAGASDTAAAPQDLATLPPGTIAAKGAYLSGAIARKAAAVRLPAYRFYNGSTGAHFYTINETERATVVASLSPPFAFEGPAFSVASDFSPGLSPVHRFFNARSGVHFYTISEAERATVVATLPQFSYEGVAYHASQVAGAGLLPFHRFYVPSKGFHFYTASESEKANIQANLSAVYTYEGIGYHVLDTDWRAEKLPHTGTTSSQCYRAGSDVLATCTPTPAQQLLGGTSLNLNAQQDGHRRNINPMGYSAVGTAPITSCVRDNITGLVWEGKEASGTRSGANTYTNNGTNLANDASGHVNLVNASNLCGYNDWRLPTSQELLTLVDYGRTSGALINPTWFPNTALSAYWSTDALSTDSTQAWFVSWFAGGNSSSYDSRTNPLAVRLVRGSASVGPRFSYSTVAHGSDGASNVVNDAWTGLQWRRCEQGRVWSGNACTGSASTFTHEQALAHAQQQTGWRLPNVKELASLVDLSVSSGASIHPVAFPGTGATFEWSSSPDVGYAQEAWLVNFGSGYVYDLNRNSYYAVRLVRAIQ